ncbi:hypothetical protein CSB11_00460 [Candidatus Campbellbacteria bacterium]|nr:MAG: hypothetical protein CSB11_00460 [Candidatus Campbellbacteria bacterium]
MFKKLDKKILYTTYILSFIGFSVFFSALLYSTKDHSFFVSVLTKQVFAFVLGFILMFFIANYKKINAQFLRKNSIFILLAALILQLLVFSPLGFETKGARRWITFDYFTIQPSEFFKYAFIIFFSAVLVTQGKKLAKFKNFVILGFLTYLPILAIYVAINDFGSIIILTFTMLVLLFMSKTKYKYLFLISILIAPIAVVTAYNFVPHVKQRLEVYVFPETRDPLGNYYQQTQMIQTIGSGETFGRGLGRSVQKLSGRIPEPLGDSIFSVFAEETGFVGSIFLIFLFFYFLIIILSKAKKTKDCFSEMVVVGLGLLIVLPAFYNIGANLGVLPLSGMPMTFVSKGGTSVLAAFLALGVILSLTKKAR